jgi:hypothetical protein
MKSPQNNTSKVNIGQSTEGTLQLTVDVQYLMMAKKMKRVIYLENVLLTGTNTIQIQHMALRYHILTKE